MLCLVSGVASVLFFGLGTMRGSGGPAGATDVVERQSVGLVETRGEWIAHGPSYRAAFAADGFRFTPALGKGARETRSLSFHLESIRRGGTSLFEAGGGASLPEGDGLAVRYARAEGIVEAYEVRPDGVEQTFRFERPLPGRGDLLVRGRIETDLPIVDEDEREGLRFEEEGLGGVVYGGVTGLDAAGRSVRGRIRIKGCHLELSLPSEFVETCVYPLVLDPLVGATITIATGGLIDHFDADVAYDATNDVYLVVWEKTLSGVDTDIVGQRVSSGGFLVGPQIAIETAALEPTNAAVANVNATDRFLVVWNELVLGLPPHRNIVGRLVDAASGAVSGPVAIANTPGEEANPDAGGDPRVGPPGAFEDAFVAWRRAGSGTRGRVVRCSAAGPPTLPGGILTFSLEDSDDYPSVSKSCGPGGRWLVAWERYGDIFGTAVDTSGTFCTGEVPLVTGPPDDHYPSVAGDGTGFFLVWPRGPVGSRDVLARTVSYGGACGVSGFLATGPEFFVEWDAGEDEASPSVDLAQFKYIVAWTDPEGSGSPDVYMASFDPGSGDLCESPTAVHTSTSTDRTPEVAAQFGAGLAGDQALVAWHTESMLVLVDSDVRARRVEAVGPGGPIADLGGVCGGGGFAWVNGPVAIGNSSFALTLSGADPAATGSLLLVSASASPSSCGPCVLVPDLSSSAILFVALAGGAGNRPVPIPCELSFVGGSAKVQWIVFFTAASPCPTAPGFSLSNAIDATIGL